MMEKGPKYGGSLREEVTLCNYIWGSHHAFGSSRHGSAPLSGFLWAVAEIETILCWNRGKEEGFQVPWLLPWMMFASNSPFTLWGSVLDKLPRTELLAQSFICLASSFHLLKRTSFFYCLLNIYLWVHPASSLWCDGALNNSNDCFTHLTHWLINRIIIC